LISPLFGVYPFDIEDIYIIRIVINYSI